MSDKAEDETTVWIQSFLFGGGLIRAEAAGKIAEIILASLYSLEMTQSQLPLTVADGGDFWHIVGRQKPPSLPDWLGPVEMKLAKHDCRILAFTWSGEALKVLSFEEYLSLKNELDPDI